MKEKGRTFDKPLQIRVSADQLTLFQAAAEADGRTLSNWARQKLVEAASQTAKNGRCPRCWQDLQCYGKTAIG